MLFEQRRFCQCPDAEVESEGHKRAQLVRRNLGLSKQFQNSRFESVIFLDQPFIGLILRADITDFNLGRAPPTNSPNARWASIGLEFAALELLDRG